MFGPTKEEQIKGLKESLREYGSRDGQETILDERAVLLAMSADNIEDYSSHIQKGDEFTVPADETTFNECFIARKYCRDQRNYSIEVLVSVNRCGKDIILPLCQSIFMCGYRLVTPHGFPSNEIVYPQGEPAEDFQNAYSCAYSAFSALRGKTIKVSDTVVRECWLPKRNSKPPYSYDDYEKRKKRIYTFKYIDSTSSDRQSLLPNNRFRSHKNDIALTHYEFLDNEQAIMREAFYGCKNLSEIEIPYGVKTIGEKAFYNCSALVQIDIPETVERIGAGVFSGCSNLEAIHVSKRNTIFFDQDGILFQKALFIDSETESDQNTETRDGYLQKLVSYPIGKKDKILEVNTDQDLCIGSYAFVGASFEEIRFNNQVIVSPHSFAFSDLCKLECPRGIILGGYFNGERTSGFYLRSRGAHFRDCCSLSHIKLSDKNLHIPTYCFCNSGLESIELPQNIISIGEHAFQDCQWLHSVEFACAALRNIGAYAFSGCKAITEITLPNSLETIYDYAFSDCSSISNITLPPNLKMIGGNAFLGCCSVESIVIPPSVKVIGVGAFMNCTSLKHIKICGTLSQITIEERAFDGVSPECIVEVPDGEEYIFSKNPSLSQLAIANLYSTKTEITIAEGETTIGEGDYLGSLLAKIVIPQGITTIGVKAFSLCRRATDIVLPRSLVTIENKAFADSCAVTTIVSNMVSLNGVSADAFDGISRENCTVYVPIGCRTLYSRHPAFQGMNIVVDRDLG